MDSRNKDLLATIELYKSMQKLCYNGYKFFDYGAVYQQTNENMVKLFKQINLKKVNNALTVTSSGDQVLNLLSQGVTNIDTFDTNRLTEYYALGFKLVAAQCLNIEQFLKLFKESNSRESLELQKYVISCSSGEYRWFWESFIDFLDNEKKDHSGVFEICRKKVESHTDNNVYLQTLELYDETKKNLNNANITFNQLNITDLPNELGTYDFIYLSNIIEYRQKIFGPTDLVTDVIKLIESIYNHNLNSKGELFYLYVIFRNYQEVMNNIKIAKTIIYKDKNLIALSLKK
ncbi:MAG: DUF3419 family protein [Bacilli bacterium]|nr:DUF3419 family protein [Bacilli bacterium]